MRKIKDKCQYYIFLICIISTFFIFVFAIEMKSSSRRPAARMGDTTAHGGVITWGCPNVLIEGKPAARMGDMHTCPMVIVAGPVSTPHVGGPIVIGSKSVIICGKPAARVGDMATCQGPPDLIVTGSKTVLIGD